MDIEKQIKTLASTCFLLEIERDQARSDAAKVSKTYLSILEMFDLKNKSFQQLMMEIPKILIRVQRDPSLFNFITPEVNEIIEKYKDYDYNKEQGPKG